jgi:hypothetical protein
LKRARAASSKSVDDVPFTNSLIDSVSVAPCGTLRSTTQPAEAFPCVMKLSNEKALADPATASDTAMARKALSAASFRRR